MACHETGSENNTFVIELCGKSHGKYIHTWSYLLRIHGAEESDAIAGAHASLARFPVLEHVEVMYGDLPTQVA